MPFSSGTFSLVAGNPVTTLTTISSTWANNTLLDIASGLSTCVLKDGTQTMTANLPMANFKLTGLAAGSARTDSIRLGQVQDSATLYISTVAGTNTVTGLLTPVITAYVTGQSFNLTPANTNTAATTLDVNSVGAKNIFRNGLALAGGELKKGQPSTLSYDGTQFNISTTGANLVQRDIPGFISGLTAANNAGDVTNDIDIAAGVAMDATGVYLMRLASSITKQSDAAWAVGTGVGGLDTGAVGNSDYYIWLIVRSDTGVVDVLFSLSSTAPTMPASYDFKRLIGWFKRVGGAIVLFHTYETEGGGLELAWDSPTLDVNLANTLTTARRTDAVKVPLNFSVEAHLNVGIYDATSSFHAWIYCPDQTDLAPVSQATPLGNSGNFMASQSTTCHQQLKIRTSATGTIAARADLATVDFYGVVTVGFQWARRN